MVDFRTPAVNALRITYDDAQTAEEKIRAALAAGGVEVPEGPAPAAAPPAYR